MLKYILGALALIVITILLVASLKPTDFTVVRSKVVSAPPAVVYPHIANLHKMSVWSPWVKIDPQAKTSYEGPEEGKGASFSWDGNSEVGSGKMTVTDTKANEVVGFQLDFYKPMAGTATTDFTLADAGGGKTTVTQTMKGKNNLIARVMCLFMDMDKMIGGRFEEGLAALDKVVAVDPAQAGQSAPANAAPANAAPSPAATAPHGSSN